MTQLVASKNYNFFHDMQKAHQWGKNSEQMKTVTDSVGQRIGVLGYGSIGRQGSFTAGILCASLALVMTETMN